MDMNKLTEKSHEAVQQAHEIASCVGHWEVDGEHLLASLIDQEDGLWCRLLSRMQVPGDALKQVPGDALKWEVKNALARLPKVRGPDVERGKTYKTPRFQKLLLAAQEEARRLKDEYVLVEHLLLALIDEGEQTLAGCILQQFNITRDNFLAVLMQVRGNQRVTSAHPEGAYEGSP